MAAQDGPKSVNWIAEIRAFYQWAQMEPTPVGERLQALWHYLMSVNNRLAVEGPDGGYYWPVEFRVTNTELMRALHIDDRRRVAERRTSLVNRRRIGYAKGAVAKCGTYRLIPFDTGLCETLIQPEGSDSPVLVWTRHRTDGAAQHRQSDAPIINHKSINTYTTPITASPQPAASEAPANPYQHLPETTVAQETEMERIQQAAMPMPTAGSGLDSRAFYPVQGVMHVEPTPRDSAGNPIPGAMTPAERAHFAARYPDPVEREMMAADYLTMKAIMGW